MTDKQKNPGTGQDKKSEEVFSDEKTSLKIHQHLSDKNDEISEQDLQNIRTDFNDDNPPGEEQNASSEETENEKNETDDKEETGENKDTRENPPLITPWNILDA